MRYIIALFILAMFINCGQEPFKEVIPSPTPTVTVTGEPGPKGDSGSPAPTPTTTRSLEGYYTLENGGYIDVYQDAQGLFTVRSLRLVVGNVDSTTSLIPVANVGATALVNGVLYYNANANYVPATNNVKTDVGNVLLNGSYLTELQITNNSGSLTVKVLVNSTNTVLFNHSVVSN